MNKVTVCISPALYSFYAQKEAIVIIVDIFRATTSMCASFNNGTLSIHTVATVEEAIHYKEKGYLVAAERNVKKCNFADFGNSPFDFSHEKVADKEIIFTTTNGTQAVQMALDADEILIGAFSNITTLTNYCNSKKKNVLILCSGWNNRFCLEDTLFAGALAEKLIKTGKFCSDSDATLAALELWKIAHPDLINYICSTEHYQRLKNNGLEDSVEYCLTNDTTPVLPVYDKINRIFILKK